ncbi:uncharacterized protein LOC114463774 [Gouania willdenowi]|uniref:uncharacterized protein LOC114463774 n=1 Tax=Gouania willdenowi TaxID=441366 RepID=UPI0010564731|nr:uncharacterized protein LOC114463774 [Gouania willdenowi]
MTSRKRRPNWTDEECLLLATLFKERKDVIRGKSSTGVSLYSKKQAWEEIVQTVNETFPETQRTVYDCNKKWENLLAKAREEIKRQKFESDETPSLEKFSPVTQIVISVMNLSDMLQNDTWCNKSEDGGDENSTIHSVVPQAQRATSLTVLFGSSHPMMFNESEENLDPSCTTPQQPAQFKTLQERVDLEMSVLRRQEAVLKLQEEYYTLKIKMMKKQMEESGEKA